MFPDGVEVCVGADCAQRNCSWTEWGGWGSCSRSCGVGQQQRIRTFLSPGTNGSWCEDILGGNLDHRFCNIRPCRGQPAHQHVEPSCNLQFNTFRKLKFMSITLHPVLSIKSLCRDCQAPVFQLYIPGMN